ncbi:MAG: TlpA family protein disulfide reductase [Acidobacteria bacterium]|nr:TlpA family protein disulfide reductase [Acidobacteriota bacterium]MBP7475838.1 TlpA family protein disulfide reductase [Pyrinomonadaceae bacterium]MBP9108420.1 TlpA family protein disulfide reductase [Pyrinomonadaceae bacterium]
MKELTRNLIVFVLLSVIMSALTGCGDTSANTSATNSATKTSANTSSKSAGYPKLSSALAEAEFELIEGGKFKITEKKGKVLMLNIWGTWCGPCRQEMPHLVEMQAKYKDQGFEVLGLNIGTYEGSPESTEDIQKFAGDMKLNYTLARSPRQATGAFYAITKQQVVPQTMLVDREGHVRGIFVGGGQRIFDSMKENLAKLMAE